MKLIEILAPFGCLLAGACSGETIARPPPPPVNWESFAHAPGDGGVTAALPRASAIAQDYLTALGAAAFEPLGPLLAEDARFSFPGMDDAHGREGVVRSHDHLFGAFDHRAFVASRIGRTAGAQTVEWTMSGVQSKDWMGVAATGKPVVIQGITLLWTNNDGTLTDAHVYFDVAVVKAALGSGPKELSGLAAPTLSAPPVQLVDESRDQPDNAAIVRTTLDALENNVENLYVGQMTDDVELHALERAAPARGKEEQLAYFRTMHKAIAQLDTTPQNGWSVGSFAIVEYTIAGEQIAPIGWVPLQRDRVVREHIVDVAQIREGKIAHIWRYDNPSELLAPGP